MKLNNEIIKEEFGDCPICKQKHSIILMKKKDTYYRGNLKINLKKKIYFCSITKEEFENKKIKEENEKNLKKAINIKITYQFIVALLFLISIVIGILYILNCIISFVFNL
jgi:hypothetical protein